MLYFIDKNYGCFFAFFPSKKIVSEMRGRDKNLGMGNEPARTLHAVLQRRCFYGLISFKLDCNDLGW